MKEFLYIKVVVGRETFRDYFYEGFLYIKSSRGKVFFPTTTFMKEFGHKSSSSRQPPP